MAALRELGVADVVLAVLARGVAPTRGEARRMDGTVLTRADFPSPGMGGPTIVALRPTVHGALLEALGEETVTLDCEATGFSAAEDRVTLRTADGDVAEGELPVGAVGTGSVIRRVLLPSEPPPRSSGLLAVRGAAHGAEHHLDGLSAMHYQGPGVELFVVRASATGVYWTFSLAEELVSAGMREDPAAILEHMSPRFDETFRAVTSGTTYMRVDELFDRDPLLFWGRGVVTLLGDAAHPVLPHTGQVAAQTMVDAVALGRSLGGNGDIKDALRSYERDRREKTAVLVAQGRRTARITGTTNPVAYRLREVAVRLAPGRTLVRIIRGHQSPRGHRRQPVVLRSESRCNRHGFLRAAFGWWTIKPGLPASRSRSTKLSRPCRHGRLGGRKP